ncbi:MAG: SDR family NAD(P)-dependent oxidoreductase [Gemmatimonadetes bacterium]|nr:SDR family NAD(P)-dependent oxidoreductase [Gemmatimonadota bacterium]
MSRIRGRLALVTGASAGIGRACALRLAEDGADLVLWARREDRLGELADDIRARSNVEVSVAAVDVRDRAAVFAEAERSIAAGRVPDMLINNAGLGAGLAPVHEGSLDDWDRMIDTNVKGLLFVTRAILPAMVERGSGHVVNIGSIAGEQVYPSGNVYCASKFAVRAITEGTSIDLLGTPIRVSAVNPGLAETEFSLVRFEGDTERADRVYEGLEPLTAGDVAEAVSFVVNAPPHVNVSALQLLATDQRSVHHIHRED